MPLEELSNAAKRREWVEQRNVIAFTLTHPARVMEEVDVLLAPLCSWSEVEASRVVREIEGVPVHVVGRALLRRMKRSTGREKDLADAALLGGEDD